MSIAVRRAPSVSNATVHFPFECSKSFGELRRMTQCKDKSGEQDFVSAGLFSYPVLMAVDILRYDIARVPVGDDQRQHLELTKTVAQRFNGRYGPIFVLPEAVVPPVAARVRDLQDPSRKMSASSESDAGVIDVLDPLDVIVRKIRRAVTDAASEVRYDPETKPGVSNLIEILSACTGEKAVDLAGKYDSYGAVKNDCAEAVVELVRPIRQRYRDLGEQGVMRTVLRNGATRVVELADAKLRQA